MHQHIAKIAIAILDTVQDFDPTGYKFTEEEICQALLDAGNAVGAINGQYLDEEEMKLALRLVMGAHERREF